jgi:hypothetical protein
LSSEGRQIYCNRLTAGSTFSYRAYGLGIRAAMPLPELVAGEAEEEVSIRFGSVDDPPLEILKKGWGCFSRGPQEDYLYWQEVGSFLVREGRDIVVDPSPGLDETTIRLFVLGPVLAVLLRQRGHLLLHASAVAVADEAVLFLGRTGWGKSTMAAVLHARGYGLATDDVAVLQVGEGHPMLLPGFPQLKLWPEALVSLGDDPEKLPQCNPLFEKRARPVDHDNFSLIPLPVKRIYVLDKGDMPEILPLGHREALAELVHHTYGAMGVGSTTHFFECANIVNKVTVCSLRRQRSISQLPSLAQLIEEDLA